MARSYRATLEVNGVAGEILRKSGSFVVLSYPRTTLGTALVAPPSSPMARVVLILVLGASLLALAAGCAHVEHRRMVVTAYDPGGESCGWQRGHLLFWRKYVSAGPREGERYTGRTASNTVPKTPRPGLLSWDTARHPWMAPVRLVFFWNLLPRAGTIAADTRFYPFGTRIYVPGWGWGVVEDRGGAIKGPAHIDLFFASRRKALAWGRQRLTVKVVR